MYVGLLKRVCVQPKPLRLWVSAGALPGFERTRHEISSIAVAVTSNRATATADVVDGKIKLFREYYDPGPFAWAFGLDE